MPVFVDKDSLILAVDIPARLFTNDDVAKPDANNYQIPLAAPDRCPGCRHDSPAFSGRLGAGVMKNEYVLVPSGRV